MEFSEDTLIDCVDLDSLSKLNDVRAQSYLNEVYRSRLFDEHLFLERTYYVLEP